MSLGVEGVPALCAFLAGMEVQHNPVHEQSSTLGERLAVNNKIALDYASRFRKEKLVGAGTYGKVYRALDVAEDPPRLVALKEIRLEAEDQGIPSTALREISLLRELDHPNVIKYVCSSAVTPLLPVVIATSSKGNPPPSLQAIRYYSLWSEKSDRDPASHARVRVC